MREPPPVTASVPSANGTQAVTANPLTIGDDATAAREHERITVPRAPPSPSPRRWPRQLSDQRGCSPRFTAAVQDARGMQHDRWPFDRGDHGRRQACERRRGVNFTTSRARRGP